MTKDVGRIELLIEVADDCIGYANHLLDQAPSMGHSKEQRYRREAAAVEARAKELREWADELRATQDEPGCVHNGFKAALSGGWVQCQLCFECYRPSPNRGGES